MAAKAGAGGIPRNGLICLLDGANAKSHLSKRVDTNNTNVLADSKEWAISYSGSTGAAGGYSANGSSTEQFLDFVNDDPWGGRSVIWRTLPDATSGADGGWNSSSYAPNVNYRYRASVWVRRHTAGTGGTFYFGVRASPNPIRNDTDAAQPNPYFSYPSQASLSQNQWYLVVAHVHPFNYTGGRHPDSGWYENGVKITDKSFGNCGAEDTRWDETTTSSYHSVYHYYTTNTSSGLEFAAPRMDKCDGTEPSIRELIANGDSRWVDASGNGNHGIFQHQRYAVWQNSWGGVVELDYNQSNSYITVNGFNLATSDNTVMVASRYNGTNRGRILSGNANNWLLGHYADSAEDHYAEGWIRDAGTSNDQTWGIHVATRNHSSDLSSYWKNGVKIVSNSTAGSQGPNGFSIGRWYGSDSQYSDCQIGYIAVWNRVLSDGEIAAAFNSIRKRYDL